jgi:hypothetical protein
LLKLNQELIFILHFFIFLDFDFFSCLMVSFRKLGPLYFQICSSLHFGFFYAMEFLHFWLFLILLRPSVQIYNLTSILWKLQNQLDLSIFNKFIHLFDELFEVTCLQILTYQNYSLFVLTSISKNMLLFLNMSPLILDIV